MNKNIIEYLLEIKESLPKKLKTLSNYIIVNYQHISIMSVAELAQNANVSTTTVMRLLEKLNYSSYSEFKADLVSISINSNLNSYGSLKKSLNEENSSTLKSIITDGISVLDSLYTDENIILINSIVEKLINSNFIYTLGIRSSKALALYFEYSLNTILPKVSQLSNETEFIFDNITLKLKEDDVLVIFSVWPSTRKSIKAAELCYKKNIPIILITNTNINPLIKYSTYVINTNAINHISGNVAITSIIETIVAEVGRKTSPNSTINIETIETVLDENDIIIWEE